jgi:hypothetical protein
MAAGKNPQKANPRKTGSSQTSPHKTLPQQQIGTGMTSSNKTNRYNKASLFPRPQRFLVTVSRSRNCARLEEFDLMFKEPKRSVPTLQAKYSVAHQSVAHL